MVLRFQIDKGAIPRPQRITQKALIAKASAVNPNASKQTTALTIPYITIDLRSLHYNLNKDGSRFRFNTGPIKLTLRQEVFLSSSLASCAGNTWFRHEIDHVKDNRKLMDQMEPIIRADNLLRSIYVSPKWFARSKYQKVQRDARLRIGEIFERETFKLVKRRDTTRTYRVVQREILTGCPERFYHVVERGDTLSKLAMFFYGRANLWPKIHAANKFIKSPHLIYPNQMLHIPKP